MSQVKALMGNGNELREKPLFWKMSAPWPAPKDRPDHWVAYAVVYEQWKLAVNKNHSHMALFDLTKDPLEKKDLAKQKPAILAQLSGMLKKWLGSLPEKPTGPVFSNLREK